MNRLNYFNYIEEKLQLLVLRIEQRGKLNILDLNIISETFFAELLNILLNLEFANMNMVKQNFEGIDLIDNKRKIIAQVSSTCTKQKIENTLSKAIFKDFHEYKFKFISISKEATKLKSENFANPYGVLFTPEDDIIDIKTILNITLNMSIDNQKFLYEFIKKELGTETEILMENNSYRPQIITKKISKLKNIFIEISQYKNAITALNNSNAVMFIGCSGIGKTDTSIMVANYYMEKNGYKFRFVQSPEEEDIHNILEILDKNIDENEVLIFDDFLGNTKLNKSDNYFNRLENLFNNIEYYSKIKFIFNARKTIIQDAKVYSKKVDNLIKHNCKIIDLENWESIEDKVNIFCRYCDENNIFEEIVKLFQQIKWDDKMCQSIFEHHNFTPLIIKTAAKECCCKDPLEYYDIFMEYLNHPDDIWEKEYRALDLWSLKYLMILYSLSDSFIEQNIVDECYKKFIDKQNISLKHSLIEIHEHISPLVNYDNNHIQFIHPSLIEYLEKKISISDKKDIINAAVYLEQIIRIDVDKIKDLMIKKDSSLPRIFEFKVLPVIYKLDDGNEINFYNNILIQYLKYMYEFKIVNKENETVVIAVLKRILENGVSSFFYCSEHILNIFKLNYEFEEILSNNEYVRILYDYADSDNIWRLMELSIPNDKNGIDFDKIDNLKRMKIEDALTQIGTDILDKWIEDNIDNYLEDAFECYDKGDVYDYDDIIQELLDNMMSDFNKEMAKDKVLETIKEFSIYNIDTEKFDDFEYSDYIRNVIENTVIEYDESRE